MNLRKADKLPMKAKPIIVCTAFAKKSGKEVKNFQIQPQKSKKLIQRNYEIPLKIDDLQAASWDNSQTSVFQSTHFPLNYLK